MGIGSIVCINGEYLRAEKAAVNVSDQGVLFGVGIFETIRVESGRPCVLSLHLSRLTGSAGELGLHLPFEIQEIGDMVCRTAQMNGVVRGGLRLTLTGGGAAGPVVFIQARPWPYGEEQYRRGFSAGFSTIRRNEGSPLVRHKTLNYFENMIARREAGASGWDEALFLNNSGMLTEGAVSNIFIVNSGRVITPDIECGLLPGVTRGRIIGICSRLGIVAEERAVRPEELAGAREAFLTNALMGVMPLTRVAGAPVGHGAPGGITRAVMEEVGKDFTQGGSPLCFSGG
ncbi:MAG: aminotransferase class IV [Firmicutes bacterium]|nr:aminotransferase class IV [Bacillota bacterium]